MDVNVKLYTKEAFQRLFTRDTLFYANSRLQAYCDPYVPFRTGNLSQDVTVTADGVTYNRSYAKYPYNGDGMDFNIDIHPLATSKWDRAMAAAKGQQLADDIKDYIERK